MANCIACGEPDEMREGKTLHASVERTLTCELESGESFEDGATSYDEVVSFTMCRDCCKAAVCAWATKAKGDRQDPPNAPSPTPTPSGTSELDARAYAARTYNAQAA